MCICLPHCNYAHRLSLVLLSTLKHCTAVVTDFKCVQIENNVPLALLQMHYIKDAKLLRVIYPV